MRKISQKEYSEYERLLKKYQQMRRNIIKAHKRLAQNADTGRLPQMVAPERERKISLGRFNLTGRQLFNLKVKHLKKVVLGGYQAFYKEFKWQYMDLYKSLIQEEPDIKYFGGMYSPEQIRMAEEPDKTLMQDYNSLVRMNAMVFAYLLKTGRIPEFRYLYREMTGIKFVDSPLERFSKAIRQGKYFSPRDAERLLTGKEIEETFSRKNKELLKEKRNANKG